MKIGIVYPQPELQGDVSAIETIAQLVEQRGFDHLLVYDHVVGADLSGREKDIKLPYTDKHAFTDPLTMFAYLSATTKRIKLMSGVLILPQRQTALVARQAADVDLLSNGRLILGVGLGSNHVECEAMGVDFHSRGRRCTEQVELMRRLWSGDLISFDGHFDKMDRVRLNPPPAREIPVWMGGYAPKAAERAGRLASGFIAGGGIEDSVQLKASVDAARKKYGRIDETFGHSLLTMAATSEDQVLALSEQWQNAGGTHLSVVTMNMGFGSSVAAHLDFIDRIADRLDVSSS